MRCDAILTGIFLKGATGLDNFLVKIFYKKQFDDSSVKVTKEVFKDCILNGLENIFGEYGTCVPIDLVTFDESRAIGIFRCPATFYVKFRAALTLNGEFEGKICCLNVSKVSQNLADLTSKSVPLDN